MSCYDSTRLTTRVDDMTSSALPDLAPAEAELQTLFAAQHAASRREPAPPLEMRRQALRRLRQLVTGHEAEIASAVSDDFGNRSTHETQLLEFVPLMGAINHALRHVGRWMRPERRPTAVTFQPASSFVRYEPLGVVGIMAPWNYPVLLTLSPLVDALAAGNRVLIKPSELTPRFSDLLKRLVAEHFPADQVAVATGGPDLARAFAGLPFDQLLFTGSTATGRKVMQAAAANLTPVTLELGGKSPAIICPDYPLEKAARSIALGKFVNAGQTCIAPDYVLVPAAKLRDFADAMMARLRKSYPTVAGNKDYTSIISSAHRARLVAAIAAARADGATILTHGDAGPEADRRIAPTLVLGADANSLLMRDEIFGPVLPILPYEDLDAALTSIRTGERPLALYCFTHDATVRDHVLDRATSGGVTINGTLLHIAQHALPFGGIGASGIGAYHGRDGFRRFSHARAVHKIGAFSAFEHLGPPWGRLAAATVAMLKKM